MIFCGFVTIYIIIINGLHNRFIKTFRLNKDAFMYVLEEINDVIDSPVRSTGIPNILKLAGTLRFLAEGGYQKGTGRDRHIGFAQPTMSIALKDVLIALENTLCHKWIKLGMSEEEKEESKHYFFKKCGIPGVIGKS